MTHKELVDSLLLASEAAEMTGHPTWAKIMGDAAFVIEQEERYGAFWKEEAIQAKAYLTQLVPRWIPVTERLPEPQNEYQRRVDVIAAYDTGCVTEVTYEFYDWTHYGVGFQTDMADHITHWMEFPKPPKGEEHE